MKPWFVMLGAMVAVWSVPASAGVRLDVDARCEADSGDAYLVDALAIRGVPTELEAVVTIEGPTCQGWLEVSGERAPLGSVNLGDPASVSAAATLIGWLLEPGGLMSRALAVHASRRALRDAGALAWWRTSRDRARGRAERAGVLQGIRQHVARAEARAYTASVRATPAPAPRPVSAAPALGVTGTVTQLNGDTAAMWGVEAGASIGENVSVLGRVRGLATQVQSRYVFVILEDEERARRVRPEVSTWFCDAAARYRRGITGELGWHVLASAGAAFVSRGGEEFAASGWAPTAGVASGLSLGVGPVRMHSSLGYRVVSPVSFIGPEPWALSGPTWQLGVLWEGP